RIVGGKTAHPGAWPWIVSIQKPWETGGTAHICGGTLISTQWVLTAAHCFNEVGQINKWRVLVGTNQLYQATTGTQMIHVKRLIPHEHYYNITEKNDIALLELEKPVVCGYYVQLACVPDASLQVSELTDCYISGWGATYARCEFPRTGSYVLKDAKVQLIDTNLCNSSDWYDGAIHTNNVCAGYARGGIDTCQGDSGGPLVCKDTKADYFWLVGVTSWGRGCGRAQQPGVYTSTRHFHDWIEVQMG
ncbi:ACRO protein, partial [Trogon melanurus]|nr:ACRO protein [Trogon melanurus]